MPTLFEFAGGEQTVHRLEQIFYDSVLADPVLQPLFGAGRLGDSAFIGLLVTGAWSLVRAVRRGFA